MLNALSALLLYTLVMTIRYIVRVYLCSTPYYWLNYLIWILYTIPLCSLSIASVLFISSYAIGKLSSDLVLWYG
jgi:hypothetical protein